MDFMQEYEKWLHSPALSPEEHAELESIKDDPKEIESRFFGPLEFGTAGLRGTMCTGLHNMNIHVIRWATQGFANVIAAEGEEGKHGVAAVFNACRRQRIRARPHQPHRKSAERHAEQRQYRRGRKRDDKVRNHAQYAACRHGFFQIDFFAEFAV